VTVYVTDPRTGRPVAVQKPSPKRGGDQGPSEQQKAEAIAQQAKAAGLGFMAFENELNNTTGMTPSLKALAEAAYGQIMGGR
jgi:hypothetical protein